MTCSVVDSEHDYHLQWSRRATLTVTDAIITAPMKDRQSFTSIAVSVPIIIVIATAAATLLLIIGIAYRKWKKKHFLMMQFNDDEVPLRNRNLSSSQSSLDSQTSTNRIQIVDHGRFPMGIVGQGGYGFPRSRISIDSGIDLPIRSRVIELYDPSDFVEFVVYISYTESMSHWVRGKLKPLIEAWDSAIKVNIYEANMTPGYPKPIERLRLITEALKIVVVVSEDYSTDEYCMYELQHAIHQQPALRNGGIIPVLTDTENELPSIISSILCVYSEEEQFETKLKQAILQKMIAQY